MYQSQKQKKEREKIDWVKEADAVLIALIIFAFFAYLCCIIIWGYVPPIA
jgi:hypothetical protein